MAHRFPLMLSLLAGSILGTATLQAQDWPTYRADASRSGIAQGSLPKPPFRSLWSHTAGQAPKGAWPGPARWDAYAGLPDLASMRNYDPVFHPVAVGDRLWFGSNREDAVVCLHAKSGERLWTYPTGGPVRVAPTYADGKLLFGCDDGFVYALEAESGTLLWKTSPQAGHPLVLHDGALISRWPIRTGVLVDDGLAYFAASLFPWQDSYLVAVDVEDGTLGRQGSFQRNVGTGLTLEGPLLLTRDRILCPQGRVAPLIFRRKDGQALGSLEGGGGSFCLITDNQEILHGPGHKDGWITASNADSREKIASFPRGKAVVVDAKNAYLLTDHAISAMDRRKSVLLWNVKTQAILNLILVGENLILGGDGFWECRRASTGKLRWRQEVDGKAYGLACAQGRLFIGTDSGRLYAYGHDQNGEEIAFQETAGSEGPSDNMIPIEAVNDRGLLDRWVFQENGLVHLPIAKDDPRTAPAFANQVSKRDPVRLLGALEFHDAGKVQAYGLDGYSNDLPITNDLKQANLPAKKITVEAWVRIDQTQEWGGIIGAAQDNGGYERGWLLGFRQDRFGFALAAERGNGRLTWLKAPEPFQKGAWYHLAATFDGRWQRLYLNGKKVAESDTQKGAIHYPEHAFYHIGAYRDDDVYFRIQGQLHEIRVYEKACKESEIRRRYQALADHFPEPETVNEVAEYRNLAGEPQIQFLAPGQAEIQWQSEKPIRCDLHLMDPRDSSTRSWPAKEKQRQHRIEVDGLRPNTLYQFYLAGTEKGRSWRSRDFELDTHFNFATAPWNRDEEGREAEEVAEDSMDAFAEACLQALPHRKGQCFLFGLKDGRLAAALAEKFEGTVVVFEQAGPEFEAWRRSIVEQGLYGSRLRALEVDEWGHLPLSGPIANLVVIHPLREFDSPVWFEEALRVLRPNGGVAYLPHWQAPNGDFASDFQTEAATLATRPMKRVTRGPLQGAGAWTHMYGSADNSAFGGETLSGAVSTEELQVQWFGSPGPRFQSDRQHRKPSPLAISGRLYLQGFHRILALDAYNGAVLWNRELPELTRFNVPRDCGNWCADEDSLWVAMGDQLWQWRGHDGALLKTWPLPSPSSKVAWDWGYVAVDESRLYGSAVRQGSSFTDWWGSGAWYDSKSGDAAAKICSESLFAFDKERGQPAWQYRKGLILNSTITLSGDRLYFLECRNDEVRALARGRIEDPRLWQDLYLVALNARTGKAVWQREAKPLPGKVAVYLAASSGKLILQTSADGEFAVYAMRAKDGSSLWRKKFQWEVDHHGKHLSRPALVGNRLFLRPLVLDLRNGEVLKQAFPEGHQCGSYAASEKALFLRAGELAVWDQEGGQASRWNRLRPDCWISTIPASGMLLSPEGGGGCSCGSWLETSVGFMPRSVR
ncbi:MAG: hypothetical protein DWQ01_11055 [Planctomycetota bacterium]|nr:MAG: hypothetical protein DWQ01_11055 [Planctomycetota bacterium]